MLLPDGKIPRKGSQISKKRIGVPLRIKLYNEEASIDAIRHFAHGIGDPNEMWDNPGHGFPEHLRLPGGPPTFLYKRPLAQRHLSRRLYPAFHSFLRAATMGILSHY